MGRTIQREEKVMYLKRNDLEYTGGGRFVVPSRHVFTEAPYYCFEGGKLVRWHWHSERGGATLENGVLDCHEGRALVRFEKVIETEWSQALPQTFSLIRLAQEFQMHCLA